MSIEGCKTDDLQIYSISLKDVLWTSFGYSCAVWVVPYIFDYAEAFRKNITSRRVNSDIYKIVQTINDAISIF